LKHWVFVDCAERVDRPHFEFNGSFGICLRLRVVAIPSRSLMLIRYALKFQDQDTLGNLHGTINYYEHVAACDSPERFAKLRGWRAS
jgi:hypothetical protein